MRASLPGTNLGGRGVKSTNLGEKSKLRHPAAHPAKRQRNEGADGGVSKRSGPEQLWGR